MADYGMTLADGSDYTIFSNPPTEYEYPASISFRDIFNGAKEATNFVLQTQGELNRIRNASDTNSFDRFMQSLSLTTAKDIATSRAEIEKTAAKAELARAQGAASGNPITSGGVSLNTIFVLAAIVGVIGVGYQIMKG